MSVSKEDLEIVAQQIQRTPRGVRQIAHRCSCSGPTVVENEPRLETGEPFPTLFYLTCPRLASAVGMLESTNVMKDFEKLLSESSQLQAQYQAAHEDYLSRRDAIEVLPETKDFSAGGMPTRVKCLHALVAHSLAVGSGINPIGDQALNMITPWWSVESCVGSKDE